MQSEHYSSALLDSVSGHLGRDKKNLNVKALNQQSLVKDATLKFVISDDLGNELAFVLMSNDDYPDAVRLAASAAQRACTIVGEALAELIVVPVFEGSVGKNSFALFPCLIPLRSGRIARVLARQKFAKNVCAWLEQVAFKTTAVIPGDRRQEAVIAPLEWINTCTLLADDIRNDAKAAIRALENNQWRPRCVFSHNDLWSGNVLIQPALRNSLAALGLGEPRIIDWLSSAEEGIPAFDLINYATSSGLSLKKTADYLNQIQNKTGSSYDSGYFDLLCGFGRLGMNRGEFPIERFSMLVQDMVNKYKQLRA